MKDPCHSGIRMHSPLPNAITLRLPLLIVSGLLAVTIAAPPRCLRADQPPLTEQGALREKIDSFRGLRFGETFDKAPKEWDLQPTSQDAPSDTPLKSYIRNEEDKRLGGIDLQEIIYFFVNNKFYAVELLTSDRTQTEMLRLTLNHAYGSPSSPPLQEDSSVWLGKKVSAQCCVNQSTGEGRALMFDNELQQVYEKSLADVAKKAAQRF